MQPAELARVVGFGGPVQQPPVHQPPGEPDPDPDAGQRRLVQLRGHLVIEEAVEVSQRGVHTHPGDGQRGSGDLLPSSARPASAAHPAGLPEHSVNSTVTATTMLSARNAGDFWPTAARRPHDRADDSGVDSL